ncbi:MAG: chemotaxis protein CheD [Desulfobacteraceae bacterium]|nr:chemotaxis protein CheD [Desulfobacteraceae bacterium]
MEDSNKPQTQDYLLKPGYIYLPEKSTSISVVLGSSVSVSLFDKKLKFGGMNHFLYPSINKKGKTTALYGNVAIATLINMMINKGSKTKHLEAQIFGGAYNPEYSEKNIGANNHAVAREILKSKKINIASEDVGGELGRKVVFDSSNSDIAILKVGKLRKSDWHPYQDIR